MIALALLAATAAYLPGGGAAQSMDWYTPAKASAAPVLLFFHGGVWRLGDKADYANVGEAFAKRGIVTAVVNYRLVPSVKHADQVEDTRRAVAFAIAHATEYGGDPKRLFLAGHSAGGELITALVYGSKPPAVAGVIPMSGIFDISRPIDDGEGGGFEDFIYPVFGRGPVKSPIALAGPRPGLRILVVVAGDDSAAMREQSRLFVEALELRKVPVTSFTAKGRGHFEMVEQVGSPGDPTTEAIAAFVLGKGARPGSEGNPGH